VPHAQGKITGGTPVPHAQGKITGGTPVPHAACAPLTLSRRAVCYTLRFTLMSRNDPPFRKVE
jgi:hypothetical protein